MPIQPVGSADVLLQLFATYQGFNGRRANAGEIWRKIIEYEKSGGEFKLYHGSNHDPARPSGQYNADIGELVQRRLIVILPNGQINVTPYGQFVALRRALPETLKVLEEDLTR
jgi:hypothetical protein